MSTEVAKERFMSSEVSTEVVVKERNFHSIPPVYAPSFVICHGKQYQNQTFCIPSDGSYHVRSVPELRGMRCDGSCYGWLILQSYLSHECYLLNPVTLNKIQLPELPEVTFSIGVLTYPPGDPKCVVMFFSQEEKLCKFCRIGDDIWIQQAIRDQHTNEIVGDYDSVVSSKGKIYLFFFNGVAIIDVRDHFAFIEVYETKTPLMPILGGSTCHNYYLESCGELFMVCIACLGSSDIVRNCLVFKLDFSKMIWENVESLGDRIFLLGICSDSVSLASSELGVKGNHIYFFARQRTELSCFDMEDSTITVTQLCPNKFRQWIGLFWVIPCCNAPVKIVMEEVTEQIQVTSSNLLPELLERIFQFLYLDGIIRFRLAIKTFISTNLLVRSFPPQALSNSQNLPWLVSFPYNKRNLCHFNHPIYTDNYTMNLPQLTGAIVRHARFGWLLMSVGRNPFFFFNPFTMETIQLPEDRRVGLLNISFSSSPTSSDYVVFGLMSSAENCVSMAAYRKVQDCWSLYFLRNRRYTFVPSHCNPVFHNGMFYCLSREGKVGVFNPNATNENDMWRVHRDLSVPEVKVSSSLLYSTMSFIMECFGEIFSVFIEPLGRRVRVYKFEQSKKKIRWLKVESLGDRLMFLSHTTSLLLPAVLKGTENRIYFPRFKGNSSVFYSLSSGNYISSREQELRSDWIGTSEYWNCTWFQNSK